MSERVGQEVLAVVDLHIRQGSDVPFVVQYAEEGNPDADFNGWTARSQVRNRPGGEVWLEVTDHLTLTTGEEGLTITGLIPAAVTEDPVWNRRAGRVTDEGLTPTGVWDIELVTPTGAVIPLLAGQVFVDPDVTREA